MNISVARQAVIFIAACTAITVICIILNALLGCTPQVTYTAADLQPKTQDRPAPTPQAIVEPQQPPAPQDGHLVEATQDMASPALSDASDTIVEEQTTPQPAPLDYAAIEQSLIYQESRGDVWAINPTSGAAGLYQLLPQNWLAYSGHTFQEMMDGCLDGEYVAMQRTVFLRYCEGHWGSYEKAMEYFYYHRTY